MNANSRLRYRPDWQGGPRQVYLEGEAYFDVAPSGDQQSFTVTTPNQVQVQVLATQFMVRERARTTQVVLKDGRIHVNLANSGARAADLRLHPGDYVELVDGLNTITRKKVEPGQYTAWKDNRLIFQDTPLEDILSRLKYEYGYQVEVKDSTLLKESFTGSYSSLRVEALLTALARSFALEVKQDQQQIILGHQVRL
ncbi:MAG: DUF4974 domain-containing protein [Bacteroidia bacterium]|nr:DUF4974 domain-containing protein [Bacteroidia bacterium]